MRIGYRLRDEHGEMHEREIEIPETVSDETGQLIACGLLYDDSWCNDNGTDYEELVVIVGETEITL